MRLLCGKRLREKLHSLPINYRHYQKWRYEDLPSEFRFYHTHVFEKRPWEVWNSEGREIYDKTRVKDLGEKLNRLLQRLDQGPYLVPHSGGHRPWYTEGDAGDPEQWPESYSELFAGLGVERGALLIDDGDNLVRWLTAFIAYPYLTINGDIQLFCSKCPFIVGFSHHLELTLTTDHLKLFEALPSLTAEMTIPLEEKQVLC